MPHASLNGRTAVVTGGARWIGRSIVERFVAEGCNVVVADIDEAAGIEAVNELLAAGAPVRFIATDVSDERSCARMPAAAIDAFGSIDVLVCNASVLATLERGPFWELSLEKWERTMAVNLRGMWLSMKAVAPTLIAQQRGSVVNMASGVVYVGRREHAHYVASKAGVIGLTRTAARELGSHGVRVNAIAPSLVETSRVDLSDERRAAITAEMALDDLPKPEDIAAMAAFLASDEAAHVTGQVLSVDSGLSHH